jgi:hypothetical protein
MATEAVMVAEAVVVAEAPPCVPPRTVGSMVPLTIASHSVTTPRSTVASALNLLDHARLGWRCNRDAGQGYRRCRGSPKQQHGAADQPGSHRSHLKSTHVILLGVCRLDARLTQSIRLSVA